MAANEYQAAELEMACGCFLSKMRRAEAICHLHAAAQRFESCRRGADALECEARIRLLEGRSGTADLSDEPITRTGPIAHMPLPMRSDYYMRFYTDEMRLPCVQCFVAEWFSPDPAIRDTPLKGKLSYARSKVEQAILALGRALVARRQLDTRIVIFVYSGESPAHIASQTEAVRYHECAEASWLLPSLAAVSEALTRAISAAHSDEERREIAVMLRSFLSRLRLLALSEPDRELPEQVHQNGDHEGRQL